MKKQILLIVSVLTMVFTTGARATENIRETRQVSGFSELEIGSAMIVEVHKGSTHKVELEGRPEDLSRVITEVKGGELHVGLKSMSRTKTIKVFITMPALEGVDISGSAQLRTLDIFEVNNFDLELSGGSQAEMELKCSGSISIDVSGGAIARIKVKVEDRIEVDGSGGSQLWYSGKPKHVVANTSGSAQVKELKS